MFCSVYIALAVLGFETHNCNSSLDSRYILVLCKEGKEKTPQGFANFHKVNSYLAGEKYCE